MQHLENICAVRNQFNSGAIPQPERIYMGHWVLTVVVARNQTHQNEK
jgi:hypothetical protein